MKEVGRKIGKDDLQENLAGLQFSEKQYRKRGIRGKDDSTSSN